MIDFKLKPVTETSWILHSGGIRLAMLVTSGTGFKAIGQLDKKEFASMDDLADHLGGKVTFEEPETENEPEVSDISGYPIKHGAAFDITEDRYPSYAKVESSSNRFAAGYYGVLFTHGWVTSYCPKITTLEENHWIGPFRTKLEMRNAITQQKNAPRV